MEIEVAPLVRDTTYIAVPPELEEFGPDVAWEDRPRLVLRVTKKTTLNEIIEQAARHFGVSVKRSKYFPDRHKLSELLMHEYVFYSDIPDLPIAPLYLADRDGGARWWFDPDTVTVADIQRAKDAETFIGDPSRLFMLIDEPRLPIGNGLDFWGQAFASLSTMHNFVTAAGQAAGPYVTFGGLILGARQFIKTQKSKLMGGDLKKYQQLFMLARTDEQAARVIGVSPESIQNIMPFLGFSKHKDQHWRPLRTPEAKALRELVEVINICGHWHISDEMRRAVFEEIVTHPVGERAKYVEPAIRKLLMAQDEG